MIKFIIVDDEKDDQEKFKNIICKVAFNEPIEIKCFKGYNKELQKIIDDKSQRKIFLLDIKLKSSISGINIAIKIRENDWDSEIIFLTNHDNLFEKVYRNIYKVFDFIEKFDNMEKRLLKDLRDILNQEYDTKMFKYSTRQVDLQLYLKEILYIYRDTFERKLVIVTKNNKFLVNKTITDIIEELDPRFAIVHRSCIVNKKHVCLFKWNEGSFILDNNEEVFLLSKRYKKKIKKENTLV